MSVSTNGQICYGVLFEEGFEFPWSGERYDGDIENWWIEIQGFKHSTELFDEKGSWIGGEPPEQELIDKYYDEKYAFEKSMPKLPVELVNCQSAEWPVYILAVPSTVITANRGDPVSFSPEYLSIIGLNELDAFLKQHIDSGGYDETGSPPSPSANEAKWYLSSYWG